MTEIELNKARNQQLLDGNFDSSWAKTQLPSLIIIITNRRRIDFSNCSRWKLHLNRLMITIFIPTLLSHGKYPESFFTYGTVNTTRKFHYRDKYEKRHRQIRKYHWFPSMEPGISGIPLQNGSPEACSTAKRSIFGTITCYSAIRGQIWNIAVLKSQFLQDFVVSTCELFGCSQFGLNLFL